MRLVIEVSIEDIAWLDKYLAHMLSMGHKGFSGLASHAHGDKILARVLDAYIADCDLIVGMGGAASE